MVDKIEAAGGNAVANTDSIADKSRAGNIVRTALYTFGDLHILVNNTGIVRDRSYKIITDEEWDSAINAHLNGTYNVTKAAWPHIKEKTTAES